MTAPTTDLLLEGTLEIKLLGEAAPQGWQELLGSAQLAISYKQTRHDIQTTDRGKAGSIEQALGRQQPLEMKIKLSRTTGPALAMALMGDQAGYSQSSGTVTGEEITAILDQGVDLDYGYVSQVVVKEKVTSGTATTYVNGVDYIVSNSRFGTVKPLSGGTITNGQVLKVDYQRAAVTGHKIDGATRTQWLAALRLDGLNKYDDKDIRFTAGKVALFVSGDIDLKSEKPVDVTFDCRFVHVDGQPPYSLVHALKQA